MQEHSQPHSAAPNRSESPSQNATPGEIQKTRNRLTGGPARGYKIDEFEILAACLFNQNGKWDFLFIPTDKLQRRAEHPDYLTIMQPVPPTAQGDWTATLDDVLVRIASP